jgi:Protein of unknwon function (DUF3310)
MALKLGQNSAHVSSSTDTQIEKSPKEKKEILLPPAHRESTRKREAVNHPLHYGGKNSSTEVIKVVRDWQLGFSLGNAIKLIARSQFKKDDGKLEDLHKAMWYLQEEISHLYEKSIKSSSNEDEQQ